MKLRHSLLSKYLLLIIASLFLWPLIPAVYYLPQYLTQSNFLYDTEELENMWRGESDALDGSSDLQVDVRMQFLQTRYPAAELFWVDRTGRTRVMGNQPQDVPIQWSYLHTAILLDQSKRPDLFTVAAVIGKKQEQGLMVFRIPRSLTSVSNSSPYGDYMLLLLLIVVFGAFVMFSWLFLQTMRRRLVRLQSAMADTRGDGIPHEVSIRNQDEIGQLEAAFNGMIDQLRISRDREKTEEQLRKQLIANISHDLRTPLTVIRQHAYSLQKNLILPRESESVQIIVRKLGDVSKLIDNLLSFTLLTAGKYPIELSDTDVVEEFRSAVADWYPLFEEQGFQVNIDLPESPLVWSVDPFWFRSILDNLFQNIIRHAKSGRYVGLATVEREGFMWLAIVDKGPGMDSKSEAKGAGIGLSIVSLMTRRMNIQWEIVSSVSGSAVYMRWKN